MNFSTVNLGVYAYSSLLLSGDLNHGFFMVEKPGLKLCVEKSCNLFKADPKYHGEHNFYIHGIHVIKVNHQPFLSENTHTQKKETFSY